MDSCQSVWHIKIWFWLSMLATIAYTYNLKVNIPIRSPILLMKKYDYRNANEMDLERIAVLCTNIFDDVSVNNQKGQWFNFFSKSKNEKVEKFMKELQGRYNRLVRAGIKHAMIVVYNENKTNSNDINSNSDEDKTLIGFLEVGLLPSPTLSDVEWNGETAKTRKEVPYLGNVAIDPSYRRQGIAKKLIQIALKVVEKWGDDELYVAVETDNEAAIKLYEKMQFRIQFDERNSINRVYSRTPRLYLSRKVNLMEVES